MRTMSAVPGWASRPRTLTAAYVKANNQPERYGDGRGSHGLSPLVKPTRLGRWSKTWSQRLRVGGRVVSIDLASITDHRST